MKLILGISLAIIILLFNVNLLSVDLTFYKSQFNKLGVYNTFGEKAILEANKLTEYFSNSKKLIDSKVYTQKEKEHLKDVKNLLNIIKILFIILLVIFLFIIKKINSFETLKNATLFLFIISVILLISSIFDFQTLFFNFHQIFFNENFMFPASSNLITLFPESFFKNGLIIVLLRSLITLIIIYLLLKIKS